MLCIDTTLCIVYTPPPLPPIYGRREGLSKKYWRRKESFLKKIVSRLCRRYVVSAHAQTAVSELSITQKNLSLSIFQLPDMV